MAAPTATNFLWIMDEVTDADKQNPLNVPHADIVQLGRGYLRLVVCELRFPTLPDLDAARPPLSFHKAMRRDYPNHQPAKTYGFGAGDPTHFQQHEFHSMRGDWIVTLRQDAVVLQTSEYSSFADFLAKLEPVIAAAGPVIDSPFFTRVGLRYVNKVPLTKAGSIVGLINSELVGPLTSGKYGQPTEHMGRVIGATEDGTFTFQHGYKVDDDFTRKPAYTVDCDMARVNVPVEDVSTLLPKLNQHAFDLFHWALGDEARAALAKNIKG